MTTNTTTAGNGKAPMPRTAEERAQELRELLTKVRSGAREVTVQLRYPVKHLARDVTEVRLRRPTVDDVLVAGLGEQNVSDMQGQINLLARMSGLGPEPIGALDLGDYKLISSVLEGFT